MRAEVGALVSTDFSSRTYARDMWHESPPSGLRRVPASAAFRLPATEVKPRSVSASAARLVSRASSASVAARPSFRLQRCAFRRACWCPSFASTALRQGNIAFSTRYRVMRTASFEPRSVACGLLSGRLTGGRDGCSLVFRSTDITPTPASGGATQHGVTSPSAGAVSPKTRRRQPWRRPRSHEA